ncbi:MAG: cob(I)yrinic acid a,c-diamide adenosyltransferase [Spirochaetia bacterium]|nr:cob(I)yrinic acid a,c-diamide adenosyltransferase [Spirochaetia bacterium]
MKIYTKLGDDGTTRLANGTKTGKDDPRVELYGTADELNSTIGVVLAHVGNDLADVRTHLILTQHVLFELGAELAGYYKDKEGSVIREEDISYLENAIDGFQSQLPELRAFILPGGSAAASFLHISRTVCRRLERKMASGLAATGSDGRPQVYPAALRYINRLSDYLFVASRYANLKAAQKEIEWQSREKR